MVIVSFYFTLSWKIWERKWWHFSVKCGFTDEGGCNLFIIMLLSQQLFLAFTTEGENAYKLQSTYLSIWYRLELNWTDREEWQRGMQEAVDFELSRGSPFFRVLFWVHPSIQYVRPQKAYSWECVQGKQRLCCLYADLLLENLDSEGQIHFLLQHFTLSYIKNVNVSNQSKEHM